MNSCSNSSNDVVIGPENAHVVMKMTCSKTKYTSNDVVMMYRCGNYVVMALEVIL